MYRVPKKFHSYQTSSDEGALGKQQKFSFRETVRRRCVVSALRTGKLVLTEVGNQAKQLKYQGADKSLARPGRKQARKHVRDACDFNNIETRAVIKLFSPPLQGKAPKEIHAILTETLACILPGRAKDLSASLYSETKVLFRTNLQQMFQTCSHRPRYTANINAAETDVCIKKCQVAARWLLLPQQYGQKDAFQNQLAMFLSGF